MPPPFRRAVGGFLPPGAGTDAVRSVSHFGGAQTGCPMLITGGYVLVGLALRLVLWATEAEAEPAADARPSSGHSWRRVGRARIDGMSEWVSSSQSYLSPRDAASPDPWQQEAAGAGRVGAHRLILVGMHVPPARVSGLLGIAEGTAAVLRRRLVTLDGVPVEVSDSWYPAAIAEGTALAADRPVEGGAVRALAELGHVAARHVEEVAVVDTPAELRDVLVDSPVIELTRTSYSAGDVPFETAVMLMSRDMAPDVPRRLRYEFRTPPEPPTPPGQA
jgi:GntR family transcriptional regulator